MYIQKMDALFMKTKINGFILINIILFNDRIDDDEDHSSVQTLPDDPTEGHLPVEIRLMKIVFYYRTYNNTSFYEKN